MSCPHCGFASCKDRKACEIASRYEIENVIQSERIYGPFDENDAKKDFQYLGIIAGKLMKKWFEE